MLKQLEGARLGIFIFLGTVFLVLSIFLLGNKEKLFSQTIEIKTYFNQIEGLKPGAPVRLSGYDIGSVKSISLTDDSSGRVEVVMIIDVSLKKFIRIDSQAAVETEGLVGKKIVTITAGSPNATEIVDGGRIPSKNPINIAAIIDETQAIMHNINLLSKDFSEIFNRINKGEGSIGKLVNDESLYNSTVSVTQSADKSLNLITNRMDEISDIIVDATDGIKRIIVSIDSTVFDVKKLVNKIESGNGALGKLVADKNIADSVQSILTNLAKTSDYARIATNSFAENMEALKHNWLFKGYFEQRGYWNQSEYEKAIDAQLTELRKQQDILDEKIKELKELENKINSQNKK
ncbi:MlaD family protein [Stygiobacter electus]|uniref:MlaD family protein n=1 Tax=Stygiobacter electus TaxID=3032292 RepID=A0AAE3TBC1_9BACT|nr:MlaD family protein [Stygiobacter electus]MDF1611143.1 MlaD family protein [Stygiobacter electus]